MKNPIKTYNFWYKIIAAALLIVLGLWIIFDDQMAQIIILIFTGLTVFLYSVIRVIPLLKTLSKRQSKYLNLLESTIFIVLGIYLVYSGIIMASNKESNLAQFNDQYYRFFIAFIFYLRAVIYFICTVLYKEDTDKTKFWTHILLITLACFICSFNSVTSYVMAIIIACIALFVSLALIIDGGNNYNKYRKSIIKKVKINEMKEESDALHLPQKEEENQLPVC